MRWRHAQPNSQVQQWNLREWLCKTLAFQSRELSSGLTTGGTLVSGCVAYNLPFGQCPPNNAICHWELEPRRAWRFHHSKLPVIALSNLATVLTIKVLTEVFFQYGQILSSTVPKCRITGTIYGESMLWYSLIPFPTLTLTLKTSLLQNDHPGM